MESVLKIQTTEMHTGGEPLRIVPEDQLPAAIPGKEILEKQRYLRENLDHIRRLLMFEPRGHQDMYGVYLVKIEGADIGAIFIHNEGYSSMCGHGVLALGRYLIDHGIIQNPTTPETKVTIACPCGPVEAYTQYNNGVTNNVRFHSVPSFLYAKDVTMSVSGYGTLTFDVSYGGAFYVLIPASAVGLDVRTSSTEKLRHAAGAITDVYRATMTVKHPESDELSFLYGTILTDGADEYSETETANICVFADKEVDRSPCGSGTTARVAQQYFRGQIKIGQTRHFQGPTGSRFKAGPVTETRFGSHSAVIVEVSGKGHYTGTATFTSEDDDDIGKGFLLR